ncbi:putative lipid-transfer protein dir1 [Phtheirospermum japonicum]|uniref:Putative lipid-transfer protein dir1 n=1 Tax=Phtheirospermum japonicum TaxID=374723 RepID=A0A830D144_9LAMI|nr:putative lipid-transfer protein dir1 [Phtheirospermum japonicum]
MATLMITLAAMEMAKANNYGDHDRTICGMSTDDLFSCRPSVVGPVALPPSAACCAALERADVPCLCSFKNNRFLPAIGIDPVLAMQLPAKCNLLQSFHC